MAEVEREDLKKSHKAQLLQQYRFQKEASLRSLKQSRINLALTCLIIAFASLQIMLSFPKFFIEAGIITLVITLGGLSFIIASLLPVKDIKEVKRKNERFIDDLEDYFD